MLARPRSNNGNNGNNGPTDSGSRIIGPPPPVPTPTLDVVTRAEQWRVVLLQHGLPATHVTRYAKLFDEEDIEISQLTSLDERLLTTLGLSEEHASLLLVGN